MISVYKDNELLYWGIDPLVAMEIVNENVATEITSFGYKRLAMVKSATNDPNLHYDYVVEISG